MVVKGRYFRTGFVVCLKLPVFISSGIFAYFPLFITSFINLIVQILEMIDIQVNETRLK